MRHEANLGAGPGDPHPLAARYRLLRLRLCALLKTGIDLILERNEEPGHEKRTGL